MSPEFWNNLAEIITAIGIVVTAYFSYKNQQLSKSNATAIEVVRKDVNSKAQQALDVLAEAKFAEGMLKGLAAAEEKKSEFEKGVVQGKQDAKGSEDNPLHVDLKEDEKE